MYLKVFRFVHKLFQLSSNYFYCSNLLQDKIFPRCLGNQCYSGSVFVFFPSLFFLPQFSLTLQISLISFRIFTNSRTHHVFDRINWLEGKVKKTP